MFNKLKQVLTGSPSPEESNRVGVMYFTGNGVSKDYAKAFACFLYAADCGLANAQYNLAVCYEKGLGTAQNLGEAASWYLKAVKQDDADAMYSLGAFFENGTFVKKDLKQAFNLYMRAAERGHVKAMLNVGYAFDNGDGVEVDKNEAFKWYLKAANQGDAVAQNNVAYAYEHGEGVAKDIELAKKWYVKAIDNGNEAARKNLEALEKRMAPKKESEDNSVRPKECEIEEPKNAMPENQQCEKPCKTADEELDGLIGLGPVKKEISSLRDFIRYQVECRRRGLPTASVTNHCVFTGNPGTGKTTVARIVARIYHEMGVMKTDKVIETDRAGLVAEYIGHTAPKTNKVIDEALDGILFIDEAYTLANGGEKDFGREAIDTLLKRMEDDRDRLIVIVAGYTDEMKKFIDANPGLQSRFTRYIEFPDYSAEELVQIFLHMAEKEKYVCSDAVQAELLTLMRHSVANKDKAFGNARYVRNCYEEMKRRLASRVAGKLSELSDAQLRELTVEDLG